MTNNVSKNMNLSRRVMVETQINNDSLIGPLDENDEKNKHVGWFPS